MSILEVKNLSHGFGDRAILKMCPFDCSRASILVLSVPTVKSTFMSIVTGQLQPDEGKVEWSLS